MINFILFILPIFLLHTTLNAIFLSTWTAQDANQNTWYIISADYNNDGKLDQIRIADQIHVRKQINISSFTTVYISTGSTQFSYTASVADFDNDGLLDIAAVIFDGGSYIPALWRNSGTDSFVNIWQGEETNCMGISAGDMNNDGKVDILVAASSRLRRLRIYRNDGKNSFSVLWTSTETFSSPYSVSGSDMDNDGLADIVVDYATPGKIYIFKQYDNYIFSNITTTTTSASSWGLAIGDMNSDGALDIVIVHDSTGFIVYRNDNNMQFSQFYSYNFPGYSGMPDWGDYNNDGKSDLLITAYSGQTNKVFRNDTSTFTLVWEAPADITSYRCSWGDYNNDTKLDHIDAGNGAGINDILFLSTDTSIPTAPTTFSTAIYTSSITLQWNDGTDTETTPNGLGYILRIGTTSGGKEIMSDVYPPTSVGNFATFNTLTPGINRFILKTPSIPENTTFYWAVKAVDLGFSTSSWGSEQQFYFSGIPPGKITGLEATKSFQIALSWTAPGDDNYSGNIVFGKYQIKYTNNPNDTPESAPYSITFSTNTPLGQKETYILGNLVGGVTYYCWVRAADEANNWSVWSDSVSAIAGNFYAAYTLFPSTNTKTSHVAAADFNNDGWIDFIRCHYRPDLLRYSIEIYKNEAGDFSTTPIWSVDVNVNSYAYLDVADFNYACPSAASGGILVYKNNGDFSFEVFYSTYLISHAYPPVFVDYNNDGLPDLLLQSRSSIGAWWKLCRNDKITFTFVLQSTITNAGGGGVLAQM
ncbi:MAG: FG-GAP-like repeat-containing protein [Elusimicrobiota bacterium]|nr:FG-GAP-like repeat-containing protein [Elusimicrobiota bacterium]